MSDPSVGSNSKLAKTAAIIFSVVVVAGFIIIIPFVQRAIEGPRVELVEGSIRESLSIVEDSACVWTVSFGVSVPNRPPGHIWVLDAEVDDLPLGPPGRSNIVTGRIFEPLPVELTYALEPCPASVEAIDHGPIEVTYRIKNQRSPNTKKLEF